MDYIFWGFVAVSFTISFVVGRWVKSYWFILAIPLLGIFISFPSFLIYIRFSNFNKIGLAVIALFPVLAILTAFFNIASSFLGGFIGVLYAKKKKIAPEASWGHRALIKNNFKY